MREININRLLDQDFQYSYRNFYYKIKEHLLADGVKIRLNVEFDLVKGIQVLRKSNNEVTKRSVNSINHLLELTLFRFINYRTNSNYHNQIEYLVQNLVSANKIPLFSEQEDIEIKIWGDKNNIATLTLKSLNDMVSQLNTTEANKILEDVVKSKQITLSVKVLRESPQRKTFEDEMLEREDISNLFKDSVFYKVKSFLSHEINEESKVLILREIFGISFDNLKNFEEQQLKSADQALSFLMYAYGHYDLEELSIKSDVISKNANNKRNIYDHILTIINEGSSLVYQRPE